MNSPITVMVEVQAPLRKVWAAFTEPEAICAWNAASDDWYTPRAEVDLRVGGRFTARMEARDGSEGFDFTGVYDEVVPGELLSYSLDDGRKVEVTFVPTPGGVRVIESFAAEDEHSLAIQQQGWQAILDSFKRYCERVSD